MTTQAVHIEKPEDADVRVTIHLPAAAVVLLDPTNEVAPGERGAEAGMSLLDFIKTATFTPLQERVAHLGLCPFCHTKTLHEVSACDECTFSQCTQCLRILVLATPA